MSIEIEVGLENAAKVPKVTEDLQLVEAPKGVANPKVRRLLAAGGAVVLAAIVGLVVYYHDRDRRCPSGRPHHAYGFESVRSRGASAGG